MYRRLLLSMFLLCASSVYAQEAEFTFLNSFSISPDALGDKHNPMIGISSLVYDGKTQTLYGTSDDAGFCGAFSMLGYCGKDTFARMYTLHLKTEAHAVHGEMQSMIPILNPLGEKITNGAIDIEGMTETPEGNLLMISEQDVSAPTYFPPALYLKSKTGKALGEYQLPKKFFSPVDVMGLPLPETQYSRRSKGCVRNKCFEGISAIPGDHSYSAITEAPLIQDRKTGFLRMINFDVPELHHPVDSRKIHVLAEHAYKMDAVENELIDGSEKVSPGVSDLLAIGKNDYLVIERTYVRYKKEAKKQNLSVIRVFRATCGSCTDVKDKDTLDAKITKPMDKHLVLDFLKVRDANNNPFNTLNIEGITWGPKLPDGSQTIIFASDNGDEFKKDQSVSTHFLIFKTNLSPKR